VSKLYNPEAIKAAIIRHIKNKACTKAAAYGAVGISKRTFYKWQENDPKFKEDIEHALNCARLKVETKLVENILDGDRLLLMFWLQNRFPDDWKDTRKLQIDQRTTIEDKRIGGLSDDEVIKELENAGIDLTGLKNSDKKEGD
jgi:hypothetical protein